MPARTVSGCVLAVATAAAIAVLAVTTGATARDVRGNAIDPGTRVNGMVVVQGIAQESDAALFGLFCNPDVLSHGRRTRTCSTRIPHVSRLFVGHGIFAPKRTIDSWWKRVTWDLWIDGQRVRLGRFGTTDRWLLKYPAAGYEDVVLREWAIVLLQPAGRHSIRYRTRWPSGVTDTTWRFTVSTN